MPMSIKKLINNFAFSMMVICAMAVTGARILASAQDNKLLEDTPNEAKAQEGARSAYVPSLATPQAISIRLSLDL
jgi:hypothetical protein